MSPARRALPPARATALAALVRPPPRSSSCSRTCTGPIPPASTSCARSPAICPTCPCCSWSTYRDDELPPGGPLGRAAPRPRARSAHRPPGRLRPRPSTRCTRSWRALRLPDEATQRLARYLHHRSEGNPFFIGELLRALEEEGTLRRTGAGWRLGVLATAHVPSLLRQVIAARAARLDPDARHLLAAAAAVGQAVPLGVWAAVAGVTRRRCCRRSSRRSRRGSLEPTRDGTGVRFVHALVGRRSTRGCWRRGDGALHRRAGRGARG